MKPYELRGPAMRTLAMTGMRQLELRMAPRPQPPLQGEVTIRTAASGFGLTQLHILEGRTHRGPLPRVLGHEIVGHVHEVGAGVVTLRAGDYVLVDPIVGCGACRACLVGHDQLCPSARHLGMKVDGGWADLVNVPASHVFALPREVPLEVAVMTASALPTAVHAVRRAGVEPGMTVAIVGFGSVGNLIAQVSRAFGATRIVAADIRSPEAIGKALAATDAFVRIAPNDARDDALTQAIGGDGADVVFEAAGTEASLRVAAAAVRPGGTLVGVGVIPGAASLAFEDYVRDFIVREITVRSSRSYGRRDFPLCIELAKSGRVSMEGMIGSGVAPEDAPALAQRLLAEGTHGRRHVLRFDCTGE